MLLNFVSDERKLAFYRKTLIHNNAVLRTMMSLPAAYYNYLGLCHNNNNNNNDRLTAFDPGQPG